MVKCSEVKEGQYGIFWCDSICSGVRFQVCKLDFPQSL